MRAPEFWDRRGSLWPALPLAPAAALYAAAGAVRAAVTRPRQAHVQVVCVGALTAGGAGKTPAAIALARRLRSQDRFPHFVSRGFGGSARGPLRVDPASQNAALVGDEPLLLASVAPCWVARNRLAGAVAAGSAGADLVILDDGFQNPTIAKDFTLVVVDGSQGFGNGWVLPAGPLREPVRRGLARADAVLLIGEDTAGIASRIGPLPPLLRGRLVADEAGRALRGRRVYAFAGIGRPRKFFDMLGGLGVELVGRTAFPDHHPYLPSEIDALTAAAKLARATLATTAKDAVRLPGTARAAMAVVDVELRFEDPERLDALLGLHLPAGTIKQT